MTTTGTTERDLKGKPLYAHIDLKKYGKRLKAFFASEGIESEESPYDPEFVKKIRESEEQIRKGEYKILKTEDLWK
jgi:hypothetical protein